MAEAAAFEEEKTDEVLVLLVHDGDDHLVLVRDTQSRFPGNACSSDSATEDDEVKITLRRLGRCQGKVLKKMLPIS